MSKKIQELLDKYYRGETSLKEEYELEEYFNNEEHKLDPNGKQFTYFFHLRENLKHQTAEEELPKVERVIDPFWPRWEFLKKIAASAAFILVGFGGAMLYYENQKKEAELTQMKNMVHVYDMVIRNSRAQFYDRVSLMDSLVEGEANQLDFVIHILHHEEDVHVLAQTLNLILERYGPSVTLKVINELFDDETDISDRIALLKILIQIDTKQATYKIDELLNNKTIDQETKSAIRTLKITT